MADYKESILFIDLHGKKVLFETEPNPLNKNQMWWFSGIPAMYHGTVKEAKEMANHIKENLEVIME
jgi:hypothetical protein